MDLEQYRDSMSTKPRTPLEFLAKAETLNNGLVGRLVLSDPPALDIAIEIGNLIADAINALDSE